MNTEHVNPALSRIFYEVWGWLSIIIPLLMIAVGAFYFICPQRVLRNQTPEKIRKLKVLGLAFAMVGTLLLASALT